MSRQRITTINALRLMAEKTARRRQAEAVEEFAARLEAGAAPDEALAAVGDRLPGPLRGLFLSGIGDDRLADAILELAEDRMKDRELWRGVRVALAYPLLVLALLIPFLLVFLLWLVPGLAEIYREFEMDLPESTLSTIWLAEEGLVVLGFAVAAVVAALVGIRLLGGRWVFDRLIAAVPLLGPLWSWARLAELVRLLGALVKWRVPLPDALRFVADSVRDADLARECRAMAVAVAGGKSLEQCLAESKSMPRSLAGLVEWGQRTGSVSEALAIAGDLYERRVHIQAEVFKTVLPPLLIVVEAVVALAALSSLLLPMISLIVSLT